MISQEQLWLQYLQALTEKVALQPGEALQAVYPFEPWDWGGRDPAPNSYPYSQWLMLNVVPAVPYQNTNADAGASQSGFDQAYQNWFNELAVGDLAHDTAYQQYQDALTNSTAKYTSDYGNAVNAWRNAGSPPTFTSWLADPAQFATATQISEDKADLVSKQAELDQYRSRIQTPVLAIQTAFNNTDFQGYTTDPNSGKSVQVRLWATEPTNPYAYVEEITGNTFGGDATKGHSDSVTITSESSTYDYNQFYAEGGAGWWDDFIGAEAGGSFSKVDWSRASSDYSMTISWQDLTTVAVSPEAWYAGANLASYHHGPYATGFSEFGPGSNFFFGPGGALSRIYTGLVVAYRPTVRIHAGSDFSSYLKQQWELEDGLEIGPFFFGSKQGGETEQSTTTVDGADLVLESQADWPMIVATKSAWTIAP